MLKMLAGLSLLALLLFYINNRKAPMAAVAPSDPEVLDTLDTSRYRTEATVDTTIDY
jgi:hypothetical protein